MGESAEDGGEKPRGVSTNPRHTSFSFFSLISAHFFGQSLTAARELSLPPLSTLSISRSPVHSPPATTYPTSETSYFPQQTQPQHHQPALQQQPQNPIPIPSAVQEPPPEAPIQSWAGSTVSPQQPRPMAPMQGMWTPDMPIKFGGPSAAPVRGNTPGGKQPSGTWDPNSGIKFG